MRYSTELKYKKYVKGYDFLSLAESLEINMVKMDTETKTGIDAAETVSKRIVQKTTEATGCLIGDKIADKITSVCKTKSKEKEEERREI